MMNFNEIELTDEQLANINGGTETHFHRGDDRGDDWGDQDRWHPHRQWHPGFYEWNHGHREWRPGGWE